MRQISFLLNVGSGLYSSTFTSFEYIYQFPLNKALFIREGHMYTLLYIEQNYMLAGKLSVNGNLFYTIY